MPSHYLKNSWLSKQDKCKNHNSNKNKLKKLYLAENNHTAKKQNLQDRQTKKNISDSVKKYSRYSERILKIMATARDKRIKPFRDGKKCE